MRILKKTITAKVGHINELSVADQALLNNAALVRIGDALPMRFGPKNLGVDYSKKRR